MKPPICAFCGKQIEGGRAGEEARLVKFADYEALPEGAVGHPKGLEWFCDGHYEAAEGLRELALDAALEQMREQFDEQFSR